MHQCRTPALRRATAVCLSALVLLACRRTSTPAPQATVAADVPASACTDSLLQAGGSPTVVSVAPACIPRALAFRYRLRPDRRLVQAFAEVHHLLSGDSVAPVMVEWQDGWRLSYRGEFIGQLPEYPSYREATDLLRDWTSRMAARHALPLRLASAADRQIMADIDRFAASNLGTGLRAINSRWAQDTLSAPLLLAGARGLVYLTVQTVDQLELSDPLVARALAAVALAQTIGRQSTAREAALLAVGMGEMTDAARLVDSLPPTDAVRAYVLGAKAALRTAAERRGASALARYLYLARLAQDAHLDAWSAWAGTYMRESNLRAPIAIASLRVNDFIAHEAVAPLVPYVVLAETWAAAGQDTASAATAAVLWGEPRRTGRDLAADLAARFGTRQSEVLRRFETALSTLDSNFAGPFADGRVMASHYRAEMYSAVYKFARHSLDDLASIPASESLVAGLRGGRRSACGGASRVAGRPRRGHARSRQPRPADARPGAVQAHRRASAISGVRSPAEPLGLREPRPARCGPTHGLDDGFPVGAPHGPCWPRPQRAAGCATGRPPVRQRRALGREWISRRSRLVCRLYGRLRRACQHGSGPGGGADGAGDCDRAPRG